MSGSGKGYVLFGRADGFDSEIFGPGINGRDGFAIEDSNKDGGVGSVSKAGDLNNDGIDDLLIGAGAATTANGESSGKSYVLYGRRGRPELTPGIKTNEIDDSTNDQFIRGTDSPESFDGGTGNDVFYGDAGSDSLNGKDGLDTVTYEFDSAGVDVNLETGIGVDGFGGDRGVFGGDRLFNIENVIGSDFDDRLTGDNGQNSLTGRAGNDTIEGGLGDDTMLGGEGADTIAGGGGADNFLYLAATEGEDTLLDFEVGTDKLLLLGAGFGNLVSGALTAEQFLSGLRPPQAVAELATTQVLAKSCSTRTAAVAVKRKSSQRC